jgi:chemotaxis protein MotB
MIPRRKKADDDGPGVPIWVLSFGDMITLLLAFFILLQSFSHVQRSELLQTGDAPLTTSLTDFGAPDWLYGKQSTHFEHQERKHVVEQDPDNETLERIIDAEDERLREMFSRLKASTDVETADGPQPRIRLVPTPIRFAPGGAALDASAADYLVTLASELAPSSDAARADIYVIGAAPEGPAPRDQFALSAQRAEAVRAPLARNLGVGPDNPRVQVLAYGIGPGPAADFLAPGAEPPRIVIAVVETAL